MNDEVIINMPSTIDMYFYNRNYLKYYLDKAKGKPVRIKCSCYGGVVAESVAISNMLQEHGNVTVEFIGFNASAATWLAFGAKNIEIHEDSMWLAHKSSIRFDIYESMNADQLEAKIEELKNAKKSSEAIDLMIAKKYADRCKKPVKDIMSLMSESRWMDAHEVIDWGFADKLIPGINKSNSLTNEITNQFAAMGLPVPNNTIVKDTNDIQSSLVDRLINGIKDFIQGKEEKKIETKIVTTMNKTFISVNLALNVEGLEENDGKITLSVDQLKSLNEALKNADNAKETAVSNLNTVIEDLDALSPEVKSAADNKAKVKLIKDAFEKLPAMEPTPQNQGDGKDYSDVALDPVNSFENE